MASRVPFRRILAATAAVALPPLIAILVLILAGWAEPLPACLAGMAVILVLALLIRPHVVHLKAIADYVRSIADDDAAAAATTRPPVPPQPVSLAVAPELTRAAAGAVLAWASRQKELQAVVAAGETILNSLPDPLILLDGAARIVKANQAAEALFEGPLAGRDLFEVLRAPAVNEAAEAVLGGGPGRIVEILLPVPVERSFSARIEALPAPTADGTVALILLHDLTRIKRADQMRADFVANASHEMRTPLSTLIGFIETLQGPAHDDGEARERFLAIMHEQATRMARLVADLLSLSRIELNEHTPPAAHVELDKVLRSVVDTLQFKASARNMQILLGVPAPGPELALMPPGDTASLALVPPVVGDADELAQVFQNLVDNAIKYGRSGTPIGIAVWVVQPPGPRRISGPAVGVSVIDRGEGIAREHLPRLTERFYRVDTARSRDLGGTGLGLAIVKHIVNRHRGALDISSLAGTGSAFTVYLPLTAPPAAIASALRSPARLSAAARNQERNPAS